MKLLLCREEKERAAAAATEAAEAQSVPAGGSKEAAEKAAKKLEGNARYVYAATDDTGSVALIQDFCWSSPTEMCDPTISCVMLVCSGQLTTIL